MTDLFKQAALNFLYANIADKEQVSQSRIAIFFETMSNANEKDFELELDLKKLQEDTGVKDKALLLDLYKAFVHGFYAGIDTTLLLNDIIEKAPGELHTHQEQDKHPPEPPAGESH